MPAFEWARGISSMIWERVRTLWVLLPEGYRWDVGAHSGRIRALILRRQSCADGLSLLSGIYSWFVLKSRGALNFFLGHSFWLRKLSGHIILTGIYKSTNLPLIQLILGSLNFFEVLRDLELVILSVGNVDLDPHLLLLLTHCCSSHVLTVLLCYNRREVFLICRQSIVTIPSRRLFYWLLLLLHEVFQNRLEVIITVRWEHLLLLLLLLIATTVAGIWENGSLFRLRSVLVRVIATEACLVSWGHLGASLLS